MLRAAWMLGPKGKGPNALLWADPATPAAPPLFGDPTVRVHVATIGDRRTFEERDVAAGAMVERSGGGKEGSGSDYGDDAADSFTIVPVRSLSQHS
jgi:hypothetical protein